MGTRERNMLNFSPDLWKKEMKPYGYGVFVGILKDSIPFKL